MTRTVAPYKPLRARACSECGHKMPISRTSCPHCGRPQLFPNVDIAKGPIEKQKLDERYQAAMTNCQQLACEEIAENFEASCAQSVAVFACKLLKLHRQIASGTDLYETFHDLERLTLRTAPAGDFDWEKLRPQAEIELLGSHKHLDKIHYACLSINGEGLSSYGDCVVQLAESMVSHRVSCFEGNTAVIYSTDHDFSEFLRCEWDDRGRICVAAFADRLSPSTRKSDFPAILVDLGDQSTEDRFIEVHVFGPMTAKTFQSVAIDGTNHSHREKVLREAIKQKLSAVAVEVTII